MFFFSLIADLSSTPLGVGEWRADDMVESRYGNEILRARCIQDPVPYCMDTEISSAHPESWRMRILEKTFSEAAPEHAGLRDGGAEYSSGPHTHPDDYPTQVCSKCRGGEFERADSQSASEKVYLAEQSILEGKLGMVARLFCVHSGRG